MDPEPKLIISRNWLRKSDYSYSELVKLNRADSYYLV